MINATTCRIKTLNNIEDYCSKNIEPLLLESNGQPVYFGKYNKDGTKTYYISKIYAKDPPSLSVIDKNPVNPNLIKSYLEALGFTVKWVIINEPYEAGFSSSRKTCYYSNGYNTYYSLKISY